MTTDDYLPISMLNQLEYCERRFWLMYVQGEMEVNAPVLEGVQQHERAHDGGLERDGEMTIHRRVYVWSERLRLAGFADVVEEQAGELTPVEYKHGRMGRWLNDHVQLCAQALCLEERTGQPVHRGAIFYWGSRRRVAVEFTPVEYKHGRMGRWLNDHVQLCAQALCLEERTGQPVRQGAIFYWGSRRRVAVEFTPELRTRTEAAVARACELLEAGRIPPPLDHRAKCHDCSLEGTCLPREVLLLSNEQP